MGARYKFNSALNLDFGAAYIFVKNGSINNSGNPPSVAGNGLINGSYDNHVVIVSGELNYRWR
jgi:long-subunit fatty acid transport protein